MFTTQFVTAVIKWLNVLNYQLLVQFGFILRTKALPEYFDDFETQLLFLRISPKNGGWGGP